MLVIIGTVSAQIQQPNLKQESPNLIIGCNVQKDNSASYNMAT